MARKSRENAKPIDISPGKPPTLQDLGQMLGLSKRAVSQALFDGPGTVKVSEKTRERVRQLAKTIGYRKNMAAAALTTKRTGMFGILTSVGQMHISAVHLAVAVSEFRRLGLSPLIVHDDAQTSDGSDLSLNTLINAKVDGVLLIRRPAHFTDQYLATLKQHGISIVQIGGLDAAPGVAHYRTNRKHAFQLIIDHLISQKYRRLVAFVGRDHPSTTDPNASATFQTRVAILECVNQARNSRPNLKLEIMEVPEAIDPASDVHPLYFPGYAAMRELISRESKLPDAILCQVDSWAWGAMRASEEAGIRMPDDLAITGYSNEPASSGSSVPLTTVAEPFEEMCREAIAELVAAVQEKRPPQSLSVTMPYRLVVRKSSLNPRL